MKVQQTINNKYVDLFSTDKRYAILMGGRGAGRSTVESQYILAKLMAPEYFRCAIMRFVLGDIRSSCFQEIIDRAEECGVEDKLKISDLHISYGANSIHAHGFRKSSSEQRAKLKSLANYNHVWVEEADEVPEEDFIQLDDSLRTLKSDIHVHLTFNPPPKSHWIIKRWFTLEDSEATGFYKPYCDNDDVLYIRTSWKDNAKNIDGDTKKRYEGYKKTKPAHYWNMIMGYVPEVVQGRIYKNWKEIEDIPHEARLVCKGLDFGFDPDPAAILDIYYYNGGYILDEVLYGTEYRNRHLATAIKNGEKAITVADSAEPKSIAELHDMDIDIIGVKKGGDSVRAGIQHVQDLQISYTKRSKNIKKEYENYCWKKTKDGETLPVEDPACANHAMSAGRYGLSIQHAGVPSKEDKPIKRIVTQPDSIYDGTMPVGTPPKSLMDEQTELLAMNK